VQDLPDTMQHSGRFVIIFFVYFMVVSCILVAGIRADIRHNLHLPAAP
jgi:hypothetical protein